MARLENQAAQAAAKHDSRRLFAITRTLAGRSATPVATKDACGVPTATPQKAAARWSGHFA
eukprot:6594440-Alexandrium_andersonii.AAC.1